MKAMHGRLAFLAIAVLVTSSARAETADEVLAKADKAAKRMNIV